MGVLGREQNANLYGQKSTNLAQRCLTWQIGRDSVCTTRHAGRTLCVHTSKNLRNELFSNIETIFEVDFLPLVERNRKNQKQIAHQ